MIWEYKVVTLVGDHRDHERQLIELGKNRWELIAIVSTRPPVAYLKRPLLG